MATYNLSIDVNDEQLVRLQWLHLQYTEQRGLDPQIFTIKDMAEDALNLMLRDWYRQAGDKELREIKQILEDSDRAIIDQVWAILQPPPTP